MPVCKVGVQLPEYTVEVNALGVLRLLNAVKELGMTKTCRYIVVLHTRVF